MAFHWREDEGPLLIVFWFSIPFITTTAMKNKTLKNKLKKDVVRIGTPLIKLLGSADVIYKCSIAYASLLTVEHATAVHN